MIGKQNFSRSWSWFSTKLIIGLVVVGAAIYWVRFAPVPVKAVPVEKMDVVATVMGTGTLEARVATSVGPKINGRIAEMLADQGDRVSAGDLLVRLDDEELLQQVEIARANQAARKAAIERLKSDKSRTAAILTQSEKDFQRQAKLASTNAASVTELDKARESLAIAQAGLGHAEAAMAEAQEELVGAEKSLEYQRTLLGNTRVTAAFDGLIVARMREPGDVVVPGSSILTLISTEQLWINAWVDETEMARLAVGQQANVVFRSEPERSYSGRVARLGRQADRETREFVVDVTVLELPLNWAVGQRADVFIEVDRKDATLAIPPEAVVWRERIKSSSARRNPGVFVNEDGHAIWKSVKLGLRNRQAVEIVAGLAPSDTVIVSADNAKPLTPGRRVQTR